jgi:hypothetical protein
MRRRELHLGEAWRNPPRLVHTIEALEDSMILSQTLELRDVVRIDDRYGRPVEAPG